MTAGNEDICGFANTNHTDGDEFDRTFQEEAMRVLQRLESSTPSTKKGFAMKSGILNHIRSIFLRKNTFHVYTTCGYKIIKCNERKKVYAYFLSSFSIISILIMYSEGHTYRQPLPCLQFTSSVTNLLLLSQKHTNNVVKSKYKIDHRNEL